MSETEPVFTTYKTVAECRQCGTEFETLAFFPTEAKRYGLCPLCSEDDKRKAKARETRPDPLAAKPKDVELEPPRRIWEPD